MDESQSTRVVCFPTRGKLLFSDAKKQGINQKMQGLFAFRRVENYFLVML